jgi:hypothetical protein
LLRGYSSWAVHPPGAPYSLRFALWRSIDCTRNIRAFTTHNDAPRHWKGDHGAPWPENKGFQRVYLAIREYRESAGPHIDVHAWQFTPDSFRLLIVGMAALGYIGLRPLRVYDTVRGCQEFCAILEEQRKMASKTFTRSRPNLPE